MVSTRTLQYNDIDLRYSLLYCTVLYCTLYCPILNCSVYSTQVLYRCQCIVLYCRYCSRNQYRILIAIVPCAQVQEGRSAKFECSVSAEPSAEVTWFKGTRELASGGEKYEMGVEHDRDAGSSRHFLVVNDCFGEDSDEYCARATNRAGARSSRAQLIIKCTHQLRTSALASANVDSSRRECGNSFNRCLLPNENETIYVYYVFASN